MYVSIYWTECKKYNNNSANFLKGNVTLEGSINLENEDKSKIIIKMFIKVYPLFVNFTSIFKGNRKAFEFIFTLLCCPVFIDFDVKMY